MRRLQDIRQKRAAREAYKQPRRSPRQATHLRRANRSSKSRRRWHDALRELYQRRRLLLGSLALLGALSLIFAVLVQSPGAADQPLPINPNEAGPETVVAKAEGVEITTPVRPGNLTGLGYHPEGESWLALDPVGKNLSANPLLRIFSGVRDQEDIRYYVMDRAERLGPGTGAVDVGAEAGTKVYAPVTGVVTAIRPDPTMQEANIVEIKPSDDPNMRVLVSLVQDVSGDLGPDTPVTAGMTELGSVADLASVLKPQLASYTGDSGNHVTVFALKTG